MIHMAKINKSGEHGGKLARREEGEGEEVWLGEVNIDRGITADLHVLKSVHVSACVHLHNVM